MNKVILKINHKDCLNTISINERPISAYSELNNFMREPFTTWSDKLFDCLERELNDEFQYMLLLEKKNLLF